MENSEKPIIISSWEELGNFQGVEEKAEDVKNLEWVEELDGYIQKEVEDPKIKEKELVEKLMAGTISKQERHTFINQPIVSYHTLDRNPKLEFNPPEPGFNRAVKVSEKKHTKTSYK